MSDALQWKDFTFALSLRFSDRLGGLIGTRVAGLPAGKTSQLVVLLSCPCTSVTHKCKNGRIFITLVKREKITWSYLTAAEQLAAKARAPKSKPKSDNSDPSAGIMDLMRDMYESGDDDMKRTISKAWTEGQDKKGAGSAAGGL